MSQDLEAGRSATVEFTGTRSELFGLLFRGYLLMLPTIGIYRFWLTTWKRRFYWQNTVIDGEPLEYTGTAMQLLIGFLIALAFFLPLYILFFYLSTQSPEVVLVGYAVVGTLLWFFTGYAIYRARDFRLSRTLWRGVRFDQKGSAWGYAFRRFGWSILMVLTLGLVYPFMAGNLWRYRYRHTWYGDRQFTFVGSWKKVAGPFYLVYFLATAIAVATVVYTVNAKAYVVVKGTVIPDWSVWLSGVALFLVIWLGFYYYQGREVSRMLSGVRVGEAALTVKVRGRALLNQFLLYSLALSGALMVFGAFIGMIAVSLFGSALASGQAPDAADFARILQSGWMTVAALIFAYLALLATFALLAEVIMGFGYWSVVARGAVISNIESLKSVRAGTEDKALAGEGLADALNVGAY